MQQTTPDPNATPVGPELDAEAIAFRADFDGRSPLDELVRKGARRLLQAAIDADFQAFIAQHADRTDGG